MAKESQQLLKSVMASSSQDNSLADSGPFTTNVTGATSSQQDLQGS